MKKAILFFILTTTLFQVEAQNIRLGVTTGINATFVLDKGLSEDPRYNSTYTYNTSPIGFSFGVDFSKTFGLSLESILSNQGQVYEIIDAANAVKGEYDIDLQYVNLPLLMRFMSGGSSATRFNFNIGPQLSILTKAVETFQANAGEYKLPAETDIATVQETFPGATQSPEQAADGTYTLPADISATQLLTKEANDFKNAEFQIAGSMGLDIDLSKHLILSTQIRASYSITDMRNEDAFEIIKTGDAQQLFDHRANLVVGLQLGLHYSIGVTRSFLAR